MIGIGKWTGHINTIVFKDSVTIEVKEENGKYQLELILPEQFKNVEIKYSNIYAENNTLFCEGEVSALPGKTVAAEFTFCENTMSGFLKLPIAGFRKIPITDGVRIAK